LGPCGDSDCGLGFDVFMRTENEESVPKQLGLIECTCYDHDRRNA
jgi:hypothetical protein